MHKKNFTIFSYDHYILLCVLLYQIIHTNYGKVSVVFFLLNLIYFIELSNSFFSTSHLRSPNWRDVFQSVAATE
jgi:hypothetical protein